MKIGSEYSGLFANFDGENIYQTPITDLTCGCSIYGSKILSCDVETRNCYCQSGFSGSRCDQECQFGEDCDDYGPRTSLLRGGNPLGVCVCDIFHLHLERTKNNFFLHYLFSRKFPAIF